MGRLSGGWIRAFSSWSPLRGHSRAPSHPPCAPSSQIGPVWDRVCVPPFPPMIQEFWNHQGQIGEAKVEGDSSLSHPLSRWEGSEPSFPSLSPTFPGIFSGAWLRSSSGPPPVPALSLCHRRDSRNSTLPGRDGSAASPPHPVLFGLCPALGLAQQTNSREYLRVPTQMKGAAEPRAAAKPRRTIPAIDGAAGEAPTAQPSRGMGAASARDFLGEKPFFPGKTMGRLCCQLGEGWSVLWGTHHGAWSLWEQGMCSLTMDAQALGPA